MSSISKSSSSHSLVPFSCAQEDVDFRESHILAWEQSGLSQADYCRQHNLNVSTFAGWKRRFQKASLSGSSTPGVKLVELKVPDSADFSSSFSTKSAPGVASHPRSNFNPSGIRVWCGEFCIEIDAYFSSKNFSQVAQTLKSLNSVEDSV